MPFIKKVSCPFLLAAITLMVPLNASAQRIATVQYHADQTLPDRIAFTAGMTSQALVPTLQKELDWSKELGLAPKGDPVHDQLGYSHQRYQQLCNGVPVFGATVAVHSVGGEVRSLNGELVEARAMPPLNAKSLGPADAISAAMRYIGARGYMWESPKMEAFIKREQHDTAATFRPKPELVYYPASFPKLSGELRLAYKLDVYAMIPRSRQYVLIDALSGEVLASIQRMHDIDEPGTAETAYSSNQPIVTYRPSTSAAYELQDLSRGADIITYDCFDTDDYDGALVPTNPSNNWNLGSLHANSILDAHWGTERTYDYYHNEHNWDSYDNNNSPMLSYVHFNLIDFGYPNNNNAFWDGERMTYGDGDGTSFHPLTAIDVLGHEITHGVTEHSAGLVYQDEPGALNESFSDIIGSCIEFYAKPAGFSWELGNDMSISGSGFRNPADPNQNGDPDTYQGDYWEFGTSDHGGVHTNSGVQNFWFYLLSEGGSGTNDNGDSYSVQGIGMENAGDIVFRSLTMYLNANSEYADARTSSIQAATDIYGGCSDELVSVTNAWYAVGVGAPFNNAVVAGFTVSANYSCTAPATIQFTNTSLNAATYVWDFGDGATGAGTSPAHTYTLPGSYTITLIATGSTQCNTTDTLVMTQPVVVDNAGVLPAAACQPAAAGPSSDAGIFNFQFGNINKTSTGAADGYQDFSCEQVATVTEGMSYPISVGLHLPGHVGVWVDLDNDGAFTASEMIYNSSIESTVHTANVIIPAATVFNTRLRVRAISSSNPISSACTVTGGQAEDYSARILDNTAPPVAGFAADPITVLAGSNTTFQDLSLNAPTQWDWAFEGGSINTSTTQNPQVGYAATGYYDVQLIVTNTHGTDTLFIPDYIHVVNSFNLCDVTSTTASNGIFYDTGGASDDYGDNETCSLLIAPSCALNITVDFNAFQTETNFDFLRFYDGASTGAPLLGEFSGGSTPSSFTTTGGELFVQWESDQSVNDDGFEVEWTSQSASQETLTAIATADDMAPAFGQAVQFSDNSIETPSTWSWDFGDGSGSTDQNPTHAYLTSGAMTVVFTATNCMSFDSDTLHLQVQEPGTMVAMPDTLQLAGIACVDSVQGSFAIYNTGGGPLNWMLWSTLTDGFEGATYNTQLWASSNGANSMDCGAQQGARSHRFSVNAARMIRTVPLAIPAGAHFSFYLKYGTGGSCETVEDGEYVILEYSLNGSSWTMLNAYSTLSDFSDWTLVDEALPAATASGQTRLRLRQVSNSGGTYDVWGIDEVSVDVGYEGPFSATPLAGTVTPGDSTQVHLTLPTSTLAAGTYQYLIPVHTNDPAHSYTDYPVTVVIPDVPCANFAFTYANSCLSEVHFTNGTTHDNGVRHWDFGDGSSSDEADPVHTYTAAGDFTVILTSGTPPQTTQFSMVVHAEPVFVQIVNTDPDTNNGTVDFTSDAPLAVQWLWDFGDGNTSTEEDPTHSYPANGTYIVILTVWNDAGCAGTDTVTVQYSTSGIAELRSEAIAILPNPSHGHFTIRLHDIAGAVQGRIMDGTGRTVSDEMTLLSGDTPMDISALADGLYILRLQIGHELRHIRITKQ